MWYLKRGEKNMIFGQKYSFFIVSLHYSFDFFWKVLYLQSTSLKICQLKTGSDNPQSTLRFQLNRRIWKNFIFYKTFKIKKILITRLHLSETYHKQAVNNKKFFYSLEVFCSFSKYIELSKYSIFHYLGYSCVILPDSPHVFADTRLALTYSFLQNFAFNFLFKTPFSGLVLSANSSLFWLVDIFF